MNSDPWSTRQRGLVFGALIDCLDWAVAVERIRLWATERESRYVCLCNAHSVVTAAQDGDFRRVLNEADMATPDGAPVAWLLRRTGWPEQERINGPDLMWKYLEIAEKCGQAVFFYGSTDVTLNRLRAAVVARYPSLVVSGLYSPPFRALSPQESDEQVRMLNDSGARVVFVGLGCPKQEKWMAAHRGRVHAVMVGVGAAFDYRAGTIKRAPSWMQHNGLEWLHRLASEPRRLGGRYVVTNSIFIVRATAQIVARFMHRGP